jgi:hypothetical protein
MFRFTIRNALWLMMVMAATAPDLSWAQEAESSYAHLKVLQPLIGTWRRTKEPPLGANAFTAEWIADRNVIELRSLREKDGQTAVMALTVICWNADTKRIESHSFGQDNLSFVSTWTADGDTLTESPHTSKVGTVKRRIAGEKLTLTMIVEGIPPVELEFARASK